MERVFITAVFGLWLAGSGLTNAQTMPNNPNGGPSGAPGASPMGTEATVSGGRTASLLNDGTMAFGSVATSLTAGLGANISGAMADLSMDAVVEGLAQDVAKSLGLDLPGMGQPVVVELFTSQGCNACPAADDVLTQIAQRPGVIALSLHVDYWDYLGWKDAFAQPIFTERQKSYARAAGERTIYTPQMIVGGQATLVGGHPDELEAIIAQQEALPETVKLTLTPQGNGRVLIEASANPPLTDEAVVQIVRYRPQAEVTIERGENAGRTALYTNVVTNWQAVADWDGKTPLSLTANLPGDLPSVVIVQTARSSGKSRGRALPGPILAAETVPVQ
ncbi:DUF1223 domain-containing protein [Phaeovulum sp. W22_SRMD_FR3]|uniref:DUF1223 domain-containing protein n=1 Tax=Phaeovulum sp. W22_SRMD_FR3 TaxID=3240274 RepID=UPI003F99DA65